MKLSVFSEQKTPLGGFDFSVINRLLGSPSYIDDLSLFVRETAQNSWDARIRGSLAKDVGFRFILRTFTETQSRFFKTNIFNGTNDTLDLTASLVSSTTKGQPYIIIEDTGTVGLAGPTEDNVRCKTRNFVSFVRNIGQDKHDQNSGGAFGFGKSVFFRFSSVRTIITYTRTHDEDGSLISRFMGMSLMSPSGSLTGRHWWGVPPKGKSGFNQPLTGTSADTFAKTVGFRPFGPKETGTAIMMLGPDFPYGPISRSSSELLTSKGRSKFILSVKEALQIWYWPRMIGSGLNDGRLICSVTCDSSIDDQIDPDNLPCPLHLYQICFEEIQKRIKDPKYVPDSQVQIRIIKKNARESFGYLAVFPTAKTDRPPFASAEITPGHPFRSALWAGSDNIANCRHVALIRNAGQVVKYESTAESSTPANEYGAVFFLHASGPSAEEIENKVKLSEPPSHDDWVRQSSDRLIQKMIRVIKEEIQCIVAPNIASTSGSSDRMGKVALRLAGLWGEGDAAGGAGGGGGGGGGSGGSSNGTIKLDSILSSYLNNDCVFVRVLQPLRVPEGKKWIEISAKARAFGGSTIEVDDEIREPEDLTGDLPGHIYGWFAGTPDDNTFASISDSHLLPVKLLTPSLREKGFFAIVKNAKTFGIKINVNFT